MNKRLYLRAYTGFTLVETSLVLAVILTFLCFPILLISQWSERIAINQFFNQFEKNILLTQQLAIVTAQSSEIHLQEHELVFYDSRQAGNRLNKTTIPIPDLLQAKGPAVMRFKRYTGNPSSGMSRYQFSDDKQQKIIVFQFQLGSGRFVRKVENI